MSDHSKPTDTTTTEPATPKEAVAEHGETVETTIKSVKITKEQTAKLQQLVSLLPQILKEIDNQEYDEIFGWRINVADKEHVDVGVRNEILLKFLIAHEYDVQATKAKLVKTLNWRNEFQPLSAAFDEVFTKELADLGVITYFKDLDNHNLKVATWNLYGNLKSPKKIFEKYGSGAGEDDELRPGSQFLRWRIGLMEKSLGLIDFTDPHNSKIGQVHDYKGVSMFKIDPGMKAATKEIVTIFGDNYPELLSTKFFVNVPSLMGWVFTFFKKLGVISAATLKKFQVMNHGDLSPWFGKSRLPAVYGGDNEKVKLIFELEAAQSVKVSAYGEILLKKLGDKQIAAVNDDVE
ncbi:CRAL/TRIO domain-containing protein [Suhomyces tanzawaensis NRRL Y-17324]|uniref:Phosphatidylinositol transfer protein SFH5 n=1 Tax=Suhomyces tanzawaensis NRRL Y-17324 TaxID=984487 RepID=A0A1E4SI50_9ASCO|nr:CRAL/TRIO domain-containing protein [Suhomyces tanzawaensis NRRL Y-17324]ODV79175.1 CRAL/TRIO domain-containing protein [Suhomyces tanzawaensis NRRL Y-17324]